MYTILSDTIMDTKKDSDINQKLELIKQKEEEIKDSTVYKDQMFLLYEDYIFTVSEDLQIVNVTEKEEVNIDLEVEKTYYTAKIKANIVGLNVENLTIESIQKEGDKEIQGAEGSYEFERAGEYKIIVKLSNGRKVEKIINMEKITEFDVFDYCSKTGKSISNFGLKSSWSNSQRQTFNLSDMGAGHWSGMGSFSGTFTLSASSLKEIISYNNVYVKFMLQADGNATIYGRVVVNYTDGTNNYKDTSTRTKGEIGQYYPYYAEVSVNKDKVVSSIQFILAGYDGDAAGSQGYVNQILLRTV